jgi:F-type H+-transporting ATPase subunit delta
MGAMSRVAQKYAAALADVALQHKVSEPVLQGLNAFLGAWEESADLRNVLLNPGVPFEAKHALLDKLGAAMQLAPTVLNFVHVVLQHQRLEALPEIRKEFEEELRRRMGVALAEVASASEMSAQERSELQSALEAVTGKRIEANYRVDAGLIGGAVVRIGSTIYDGSVRERLNRLQTQLEAAG